MYKAKEKKQKPKKAETTQAHPGQPELLPATPVIRRTATTLPLASASPSLSEPLPQVSIRQMADVELIEAVAYSLLVRESISEEKLQRYILDQIEVMERDGEYSFDSPENLAETVGRLTAWRIRQEQALTMLREQVLDEELLQKKNFYEDRYRKKLSQSVTPAAKQREESSRNRNIQQVQETHSLRMEYLHHPQQEQTDSRLLYRSDKYFYHATPVANLDSIRENGLEPQYGGSDRGITQLAGKMKNYGQQCRGKIHLTDFLSTADAYAYDKVTPDDSAEKAILRFPQAFLAGTPLSIDPDEKDTAFTTSSRIPPQFLEIGIVQSEEKDEHGALIHRILSWVPLIR